MDHGDHGKRQKARTIGCGAKGVLLVTAGGGAGHKFMAYGIVTPCIFVDPMGKCKVDGDRPWGRTVAPLRHELTSAGAEVG